MAKRATTPPAPTLTPEQSTVVAAADRLIAGEKRRVKSTAASRQRQIEIEWLGTESSKVKNLDAAFTAAAMVMDPDTAPNGGYPTPNAITRTWQHAAWGYTRSVPELNAAMMFVGNCLSRCKLVVGKRDPDGSVEQGFDGDEPVDGLASALADEAAQYINKLQTPRGGQSEILRGFGEKIFVAGECYIVPEDLPTGLTFEVLSTQELIPEGKGWLRYYGPGWTQTPLPKDTKPIRVWRSDSQYQMLSSSSVRASLEILEELVVLTRLVRAAAISRMSLAGILLIPDELDTPDDDDDADGQTAEAKNPLAVDIINTGAKAIDDPAAAAAWMPYLLQGPAEFLAHVRHVPFETDDQENVIKRTEAVERLARGLDLPPEKVLGHMGTTYANAGQVSEDNFNLYIEPALQMICDALTTSYLWPAMAAGRSITPDHLANVGYPEDIMSVAITYDARKLISKPDRSAEIVNLYLHDMTFQSVKISEVREAVGLDPDGEVEDGELAKRIDAYRLGRIREVIPAPPSDAAVPIQDAEQKGVVPGQSGGAKLTGTSGKTVQETVAAQKAEDAAASQGVEDAILASAALDSNHLLAVKICGTAEFTIDRCLERVGSRIRNKRGGSSLSESEKSLLDGVDNGRVTRVLGPVIVNRVLGSNDDPALAEISTFTSKVGQWAREAEVDDPSEVVGSATVIVTELTRRAMFEEPSAVTPDLFLKSIEGVRVGV